MSHLPQAQTLAAMLTARLETCTARVVQGAHYVGAPDKQPDAWMIVVELRPEFVGHIDPGEDNMDQEHALLWSLSRASDENFWWDDLAVAAPYRTPTTFGVWFLNQTDAVDTIIAHAATLPMITLARRAEALEEVQQVI